MSAKLLFPPPKVETVDDNGTYISYIGCICIFHLRIKDLNFFFLFFLLIELEILKCVKTLYLIRKSRMLLSKKSLSLPDLPEVDTDVEQELIYQNCNEEELRSMNSMSSVKSGKSLRSMMEEEKRFKQQLRRLQQQQQRMQVIEYNKKLNKGNAQTGLPSPPSSEEDDDSLYMNATEKRKKVVLDALGM